MPRGVPHLGAPLFYFSSIHALVYIFLCLCYSTEHMEIIQLVQPALPFIQIILAVLLIASILLQQRGSSLGGAFGGDNFSSAFHKRRGAELFLFKFSIGIAILFVLSAFVNVLL
jgi:protein translocase SecG subunit